MIDPEEVHRSIEATREGLAAANYAIDCRESGEGRLVFTVRPLDDACEECLVPKVVFVDILKHELLDGGVAATDVDVVYPLDEEA